MLVIEVDDSTHNRRDRVERDDFINSVLEKCGILIQEQQKEEILRFFREYYGGTSR